MASVYRHDHWDLYLLSPQGALLRRLTFGEGVNRAPSWSPDGKVIAFESNRSQNWDIYVMSADGGNLRRLTTHAGFDGSPRWSPDGKHIAFTADREGDLDIFVMESDGSHEVNLTPRSQAHDYDPGWSPDGKQIVFTSIRDGNKEIYVMNADGGGLRNLTQSKVSDEENPVWSPDGSSIAFVSDRSGDREVHIVQVASPQSWHRVTSMQTHKEPAWAPDGSALVFVTQSETGQALRLVSADGSRETSFSLDRNLYRQPDWNGKASAASDPESLRRSDAPLYLEDESPNAPQRQDRFNLVELRGMRMKLPAWLSDRVDDSFVAWRQRVERESGTDFLGNLSEAYRPLSFRSEGSDYLSWHKAGRAIDTLWDYNGRSGRIMEIAREDVMSETHWRIYLRAAKQDGSQGEPLRQAVWDVSPQARARSRGLGGLVRGVLPGYYVDVTELGRQYGWMRIPSHTLPDFDWRRDFQAMEYWHYQKTDDLTWWEALREIYPPDDYGSLFSYETLRRLQYNPLIIAEKGIGLPPEILERFRLLQP